MRFMRNMAGLLLGGALLCAAVPALAAGSYALTVYGEAPKYPAGFQHFDFVDPDAPKGGSLSRASMEIGQYNYITPYADQGISVVQVNDWVYAPLAFRSLDEPYTVYALVAQQMERDPEGLWVRFTLNPKARFADGTPITAEDVRYTFNLLMTKGSLSYRQQYADVQDVLIEGPRQVRFTFKNNLNRTLALDLATLRVVPEHWWKTRDFANGGGFEPPLGSGPYRVSKVDAGRSISFQRDPDWWGKDLPVSRGMYNFDTLTVNFYGDTDVARQLLQAGAFDYNREFSSSGYVVGYDSPALRDGRLQQAILAPEKPTAAQGFVFNLQNPIFQDRRVRQAISLLWDFEWTNKQMMRGFYVRQNSFWPKSEMAATALPDAEELKILEPLRGQIPDEVFTQVYQAPKTDGSGYIRDKQLQALKLLAEAGWTPQHSRLVNADGEPLAFTFLDGQGGFDRMLLPFKRTLAQIGITPEFTPDRFGAIRQSAQRPRLRHDRHQFPAQWRSDRLPRPRTVQPVRLAKCHASRQFELDGAGQPGGRSTDRRAGQGRHPRCHGALRPRPRPGAAMGLLHDSQLLLQRHADGVSEPLRHARRATGVRRRP